MTWFLFTYSELCGMLNWQYVNTKSNSYLYSQPWRSENEVREVNAVVLKRCYPEACWRPDAVLVDDCGYCCPRTWTQRGSYIKGEMFLILFEKEMLWSGWRWFWSSWCDTTLESRAWNIKQELYDLPPHANMPAFAPAPPAPGPLSTAASFAPAFLQKYTALVLR